MSTSERYGWPLHVIEDAAGDPPWHRPEAFLDALRLAVAGDGTVVRQARPRFEEPVSRSETETRETA